MIHSQSSHVSKAVQVQREVEISFGMFQTEKGKKRKTVSFIKGTTSHQTSSPFVLSLSIYKKEVNKFSGCLFPLCQPRRRMFGPPQRPATRMQCHCENPKTRSKNTARTGRTLLMDSPCAGVPFPLSRLKQNTAPAVKQAELEA